MNSDCFHSHQPRPQYQAAQHALINPSSPSSRFRFWGYRPTYLMRKHFGSALWSHDAPQQQRPRQSVSWQPSTRVKSVGQAQGHYYRRPCSSYSDSPVRRGDSEIPEYIEVSRSDRHRPTWDVRSQSAPQMPSSPRRISPSDSRHSEPRYSSSLSRSSLSSQTKHSRRRTNVFVFGSTGAGKSTFIRTLVSQGGSRARGPRQGHSLESCTSEYEGFLYVTSRGQEVILFDTPGFDDSRFSDAENLADMARCLQGLLKQGQCIDGVIFINPVTDVRLRGSALKMVEVIKRVCGPKFYKRVALVTSMWDTVDSRQIAKRRESMMLESPQFWGDFHQKGNSFRFENDFGSADEVVQWLLEQSAFSTPMLKMSQELQDGLLLSETEAGQFLLGQLSKQRDQHVEAVMELRREILKAKQAGDRATANDFAEEERYERSCAREVESAREMLHSRNALVR